LPGLCGYVSISLETRGSSLLCFEEGDNGLNLLLCLVLDLYIISAAAISQDSGSCNAIKIAEPGCCPSSVGPTFSCDYCDGGVENPDTVPFTGGITCADYAEGQVLQYISL
jgi:hypothetical protein